jgi:hypothetical protein
VLIHLVDWDGEQGAVNMSDIVLRELVASYRDTLELADRLVQLASLLTDDIELGEPRPPAHIRHVREQLRMAGQGIADMRQKLEMFGGEGAVHWHDLSALPRHRMHLRDAPRQNAQPSVVRRPRVCRAVRTMRRA